MSEKRFLSKREWLNSVDSDNIGAINSRVYADAYGVECSIDIWDCGRKVCIDLGSFNTKSIRDSRNKLKKMVNHFLEVQKALDEAYDHFSEEDKKRGGVG